jgi:hypothetical protein
MQKAPARTGALQNRDQRIPAEPEPLPAELLGLAELFEPPIELPLFPAPAVPAFGAVRVADEPVVMPLRSDLLSRFIPIVSFVAGPVCWLTPGVCGVGAPGCNGAAESAAASVVDNASASAEKMTVFFMGSSLRSS